MLHLHANRFHRKISSDRPTRRYESLFALNSLLPKHKSTPKYSANLCNRSGTVSILKNNNRYVRQTYGNSL